MGTGYPEITPRHGPATVCHESEQTASENTHTAATSLSYSFPLGKTQEDSQPDRNETTASIKESEGSCQPAPASQEPKPTLRRGAQASTGTWAHAGTREDHPRAVHTSGRAAQNATLHPAPPPLQTEAPTQRPAPLTPAPGSCSGWSHSPNGVTLCSDSLIAF